MPWFGLTDSVPIQTPAFPANQEPQLSQMVFREKATDDELTVLYGSWSYDAATDTFNFADGVRVLYGKSVLTSERLTVRPGEVKKLRAEGKVRLTDPDGQFNADDLEICWKVGSQTGTATNVVARIADATITAEKMDIKPDRFEFHNVTGTTCLRRTATYMLTARNLVVIPGSYAVADRPTLYLFGKKIIDLPIRRYSLDRRSEGVKIPAITYRQGFGVGVSWTSGFLINTQTNLTVATSFFRRLRPSYGLLWTRSFVPTNSSTALVAPRSEILERFNYGFLDSIENPSPEAESNSLRVRRSTLSVGTTANETAIGLGYNTQVSKILDAAYEIGGNVHGWGLLGTSRFQTLRENNDAYSTRGSFRGTISAPVKQVSKTVSNFNRLEIGTFVGTKQFTWGILQSGVTYHPGTLWSLSAGAFASQGFGTPEFKSDQLFATRGMIWRIDYRSKLTKISFLRKWDVNRKWFDQEYLVSQAVGCVEPYVLYRQFPGDFRVGIRLRLDDITDVFRNRTLDRNSLKNKNRSIVLDGK